MIVKNIVLMIVAMIVLMIVAMIVLIIVAMSVPMKMRMGDIIYPLLRYFLPSS